MFFDEFITSLGLQMEVTSQGYRVTDTDSNETIVFSEAQKIIEHLTYGKAFDRAITDNLRAAGYKNLTDVSYMLNFAIEHGMKKEADLLSIFKKPFNIEEDYEDVCIVHNNDYNYVFPSLNEIGEQCDEILNLVGVSKLTEEKARFLTEEKNLDLVINGEEWENYMLFPTEITSFWIDNYKNLDFITFDYSNDTPTMTFNVVGDVVNCSFFETESTTISGVVTTYCEALTNFYEHAHSRNKEAIAKIMSKQGITPYQQVHLYGVDLENVIVEKDIKTGIGCVPTEIADLLSKYGATITEHTYCKEADITNIKLDYRNLEFCVNSEPTDIPFPVCINNIEPLSFTFDGKLDRNNMLEVLDCFNRDSFINDCVKDYISKNGFDDADMVLSVFRYYEQMGKDLRNASYEYRYKDIYEEHKALNNGSAEEMSDLIYDTLFNSESPYPKFDYNEVTPIHSEDSQYIETHEVNRNDKTIRFGYKGSTYKISIELEDTSKILTASDISSLTENQKEDLLPDPQEVLAKDENEDVRKAIARREDLLPELQDILAKDEDFIVRFAIASRGDLLPELQDVLAKDEDFIVREGIAEREDLLPELQEVLAKDKSRAIRKIIAERKDLLPELQDVLAKDESWTVRKIIASRGDLLPELQEVLAKDEYFLVRKAIANRDDLSYNLLNKLADDKEPFVQQAIAYRKGLPTDIVKKLVDTNDTDVITALEESHNMPENHTPVKKPTGKKI